MATILLAMIIIVVTAIVTKFSEDLYELARDKVKPLAVGRGRGSRNGFSDMFNAPPVELDYFVFTVTARHFLPVMDVLYFTYVRHLIESNKARYAAIYVWYHESDTPTEWSAFEGFISRLFHGLDDRVEVISSRELANQQVGPPPQIFWNTLDRLSDLSFIERARNWGAKVSRLEEMNKARPTNVLLRGIVAHSLFNSYSVEDILDSLAATKSGPADTPSLGVLCWELEIDRLGVYYEAQQRQGDPRFPTSFDLHPILGLTVLATRKSSSDNHSEATALCLSYPVRDQVDRLGMRTKSELRRYVEVLETILQAYGVDAPESTERRRAGRALVANWTSVENPITVDIKPRAYEIIYLMNELQIRWRRDVGVGSPSLES